MRTRLTTMAAASSLLLLAACGNDSTSSDDIPVGTAGTSSSTAGAMGGVTAGVEANGASGTTGGTAGAAAVSTAGSLGTAGEGTAGSSAGFGTSGTGSSTAGTSADAGAWAGDFTSRAVTAPPTYQGNGSSGCNMARETTGFEPDDAGGGKHPLFLYFVGTRFVESDTSARFDSDAAAKVTDAMARRGFVALSVDYDNSLSFSADKLSCLFASSNAMSVLALACALPNVDCDLGIATWGHSQGALMAHASSNFDDRVRAVWTTGYSGGDYPLSDTRLRVVNGEADTMNSSTSTLNKASGMSATDCPDDGRSECLRPDGSGWIRVKASDCVSSSADHCWFDRTACSASAITLEPSWIGATSTKAFALEANADWVAETLARP